MKNIFLIISLLVSSVLLAKESGFSLSTALVGMSMDYGEYNNNGVILDSEKSSFSGITGSELIVDYTKVHGNYNYSRFGIEMQILGETTEYIGFIIDDPCQTYGCYTGTTQNAIFDIAGSYMYTHSSTNELELSYGLALGYRSWERALSSTQIEVYYWYSIRPRVKLTYTFSAFTFGTLLEYQYGINPKMSATDFSSDFNLGSADIVKVKVPLQYKLSAKIDFFLEYVLEQQIIEKSNVQRSDSNPSKLFLEPDSTANNQYAKIGVTFKF